MSKLDLKKDLKHLYNPSAKEVTLVDVPPLHFLMADGSGDPNTSQAFRDAMMAVYSVAFTLKFMIKQGGGVDYTVMPLEGLWWTDDMGRFSLDAKGVWLWTVLIAQPDFITAEQVGAAVEETHKKRDPAALSLVRFEPYHEGLAAQIMHIGSYSAEAPTIMRLHGWIAEHGYEYQGAGRHHEIYLSDPRRTAPEKLRTVIRQPVRKPLP
jgi:hypothetical protein